MPFLDLPSHRLHYRIDGGTGPWLVLCNSLGTDLHMWDSQVAAFAARFRVLRYDRRGHGRSTSAPPPYSLEDLGADVVALFNALGIEQAHFCGLSIGGLVGQWLAIHASDRIDKLVLCATAARIGTYESWQGRVEHVRSAGLSGLVEATAERWFTPEFRARQPDVVQGILDTFAAVSPAGYIGCCAALADADLRAEVSRISRPVFAVSGAGDSVCSPSDMETLANDVQDGRHLSLPGHHIVNVESAEAFNDAVLAFLFG